MNTTDNSRKLRRIVVYSLSAVLFTGLFFGILYGLQPMLLPLILGTFLAYLFKPLVNYRGSTIKKYLRAGFLILSISTGIYWVTKTVKESLPNEREKLILKVRLQYRLDERYQAWLGLTNGDKGNFIYKMWGNEITPMHTKAMASLKLTDDERKQFLLYHDGLDGEEPIPDKYFEYYLANVKAQKADMEKLKAKLLQSNQASVAVPPEDASKLSHLMTTFSHWLIFPLAFMFILLDKGQIFHFFMRLVPNRYFELTHAVMERVDEALGKYIRGTMIECALVGLTLIVGFYLSGMEFKIAFLIGAVGGLTNAVPFVGTFIACIIGVGYSLIAEDVSPILPFINQNNMMVAVLGVVMIAHLLDNAVYQPLVVGSAVNIHPLVVVMGVFGGSLMFGFAGLIFAIPTIVIIKVVTETFFSGLKDYRII